MTGKSKIEWTEQTAIVDRGGSRIRFYIRKRPHTPGAQLRRKMASEGLSWCRGCLDWVGSADVRRGACRSHRAAEARRRYAFDPAHRNARREHSYMRKFGVPPVPHDGKEALTSLFGGECAYCDAEAETWDHVFPVSKGGRTEPANVLPSCVVCNSSKKDNELFDWLEKTRRVLKIEACERLAHFQVLDL
jgi:hypothetical protein